MSYTRTTTINSAPGGDTVKTAILDLDTDLTGSFVNLNTHEGLTATHGATGAVVGTANTQTLTNKTINLSSNTLTGIAASSFVLSNASGNIDGSASQKAIPAGSVVGTSDTQTLTNKTINLSNNTLSATIAQLNAACSDSDLVDTTSNQAIGGIKTFSTRTLIGGGTDDGVNQLQVNGGGYFGGGIKIGSTGLAASLYLARSSDGAYASSISIDGSDLRFDQFADTGAIKFMRYYGTQIETARFTSTGNLLVGTTTDDGVNALQVNGGFAFAPATTTSAPSAGGAGALPATPLGYMTITVNGTARKVAYY